MVIVVDTNVRARALLGDDPAQSPRARQALAAARSREGVFVPLVVLAELSWVLRVAGWARDRVLDTLDSLLRTRGVAVETPEIAADAIRATRAGGRVGFADHLIAEVGFANGYREALTYDRLLARKARVRRLP